MTHGENGNNMTDVADNKMTKLGSTEVSRNKAVEYIVDSIVNHKVVNGMTLYHVQWYGYRAKDDTTEPADHLLDHFNENYLRHPNRKERPHCN